MPDLSVAEAKDALGIKEDDWSKAEEVSTGGNFEGETWDFKTQKEVKGTYIGSDNGIKTKFGERVIYHLQDGDTLWNVWETAQLKNAFDSVQEGDRVKITYLGKEQTNRGNQVNTFKMVRIKQ